MITYSQSIVLAIHIFWITYWWGAFAALAYKFFKIKSETIGIKYYYASYVFGIVAIVVSRG